MLNFEAGAVLLRNRDRASGDSKIRAAVVISPDERNQISERIIVVPFTSEAPPTGVRLLRPRFEPTAQNGLEVVSYAMPDWVATMRKTCFRSSLGQLAPEELKLIRERVGKAIALT
jgi:mRNA interferase MazF